MPNPKKIAGTPLQIGSALFCELLGPAIAGAVAHLDKDALVQLYTGLICAAHGGMVSDLGKATADEVIFLVGEVTKTTQFPSNTTH